MRLEQSGHVLEFKGPTISQFGVEKKNLCHKLEFQFQADTTLETENVMQNMGNMA